MAQHIDCTSCGGSGLDSALTESGELRPYTGLSGFADRCGTCLGMGVIPTPEVDPGDKPAPETTGDVIRRIAAKFGHPVEHTNCRSTIAPGDPTDNRVENLARIPPAHTNCPSIPTPGGDLQPIPSVDPNRTFDDYLIPQKTDPTIDPEFPTAVRAFLGRCLHDGPRYSESDVCKADFTSSWDGACTVEIGGDEWLVVGQTAADCQRII